MVLDKKTGIYIAATIIAIVMVTFVSTLWTFFPILDEMSLESAFSKTRNFSYFAAIVTGFTVIVIGIPIYTALKNFGKAKFRNLAAIGFLISTLLLLSLFIFESSAGEASVYSSGQNYHGAYRAMVVENELTFWGWLSFIEQILTLGIYGLLGALSFGISINVLSKYDDHPNS